MDVSIIIVNYNTKELTANCINSIFSQTKKVKFEIILVDNASTDGSIEYFKTFENIKYIVSEKNLGFGKANNLGYNFACGKYIFLLNSDTIFINNALSYFLSAISNLPDNIACIGSALLSEDGLTYTTSYGSFPKFSDIATSFYKVYLEKLIKIKINQKDILKYCEKPIDVDYITGANLFIRRTVIEKLRLFDPDFFMYFEETELQYRYWLQGNYKSQLIFGPRIIHLEPHLKEYEKKVYTSKQRYIYFEGMFLYYKKRYPLSIYLIWRTLYLIFIPLIFKTKGTLKDKLRLFLLFIGVKSIKH